MEPFFEAYRDVMPFLITSGNEPTRERLQTPQQRARFDDTTKCILCAACTSSCPVFWTDGQYFGPAGDRRRAPVHLRQPRRGRRPAPGDPQRQGGRVALPHDLQLHRGVPARHRGHQGDPGGQARPPHPQGLTVRRVPAGGRRTRGWPSRRPGSAASRARCVAAGRSASLRCLAGLIAQPARRLDRCHGRAGRVSPAPCARRPDLWCPHRPRWRPRRGCWPTWTRRVLAARARTAAYLPASHAEGADRADRHAAARPRAADRDGRAGPTWSTVQPGRR